MPPLADQFSTVLNTPIPFAVALVFFGIVFWRVFEWRYRATFEKMKEMSELARIEVNQWKDAAARSATEASKQLELAKKKEPAEETVLLDKAVRPYRAFI